MIDLRTNSIRSCKIKIDKGDGPDSVNSFWNFEIKPYYLNYELFGYLHRKNRLDYNLKITKYDKLIHFKNDKNLIAKVSFFFYEFFSKINFFIRLLKILKRTKIWNTQQ